MSYNSAFKDLKINKQATTQQWDKLFDHEKSFGSKTYYLLYCGQSLKPPKDAPTRSDCLGIPSIDELGLGVVETKVISNIRTTLKPSKFFFFKYVFPKYIDSIRKLLCCPTSLPQPSKTFNRSEIETRGYQRIYFSDSDETNDANEQELEPVILENGNAPIRLIITGDQNASR